MNVNNSLGEVKKATATVENGNFFHLAISVVQVAWKYFYFLTIRLRVGVCETLS